MKHDNPIMRRILMLTCLVSLAGCNPSPSTETISTGTTGTTAVTGENVSTAAGAGSTEATATLRRTSSGRPDLSGIWQTLDGANWNLEPHAASQGATEVLGAIGAVPPGRGVVTEGRIPYLPAALAQRDLNFAQRRTDDPEARCYRPGVPRATYMPYPFQIFQTDAEIFIAYQYAMATRSVNLGAPVEAPFDSWMGWSNGHWDGDTLVVEVTGLNGQAWLDRAGNYLSAGARVVERYTPLGPDHLRYEATIDDPSLFSAPWTIALPLYRHIDAAAELLEFKCVEFAEELMYGHLAKPVDTAGGDDDGQ